MELRLDDTGFGGIKILQNPEEFCYGVDAVLLADFAAKKSINLWKKSGEGRRIMDLGTGTGIVPLIMSHKTSAGYIGGIELQRSPYELAVRNAVDNGLSERLHFFHRDVNEAHKDMSGTFDVVTANPPYTEGTKGIESGNRAKAIARHETTASLKDFIGAASRLLKDKGDFYMVHRPARMVDICQYCREHKLEPKDIRFVSGKPDEKPNLMLIHCVKGGNPQLRIEDPLWIHEKSGEYSAEILKIYEK